MTRLVVDRAAVEALVARRRDIRQHGFRAWVARRFAVSLIALYAVAFAVKALMSAPAFRDMTGWSLTVFFGVPAFMAFIVTIAAEQLTFGDSALDAERMTKRISREIDQLTGSRWPLRVLRSALELAVCAGIVLGVVVRWTGRPAMLARGSDQAIVVFATGILLSCIILMFGIRAASLSAYRSLLRADSPGVADVPISAPVPALPDSEISLRHPSGSGSGSA